MVSPSAPPAVSAACSPFCHAGKAKTLLTPPPPAPPCAPSFHTLSAEIALLAAASRVPPQARACGLDAGKSTWLALSFTPSLEPLSPEATQTVIPIAAADWKAESNAVMACSVHADSGPPQLIDITDGLLVLSCTAVEIASRKPASVFGPKYTAIFAPGATAPTTSISSITSPSGPFASPVGRFLP